MSDTVIKVENLSKQYRIGAKEGYKTFRETLVDAAKAPFQSISNLLTQHSTLNTQHSKNTIWALKDVSFDVKRGEVVGVIGRNGAGKSTLLKILSKITEPTEGRVEMRGRIGSLLEVGTGFHPELTGHENIYLYGAILGMDRWEISRKFDEIVAFAELEKFVDTPVKRYSSGMYMRLAFSVAAHLEPEILLIDEVLAVGDALFQTKCLAQMKNITHQGNTVLFVSHNMGAVTSTCKRAIVLESGTLIFDGGVYEGIQYYERDMFQSEDHRISLANRHDRKGTGDIKLTEFFIENSKGQKLYQVPNGENIKLIFGIDTKRKTGTKNVDLNIVVEKMNGDRVFQFGTRFTRQQFKTLSGKGKIIGNIKRFPLVPGRYRINAYLEAESQPADYITPLTFIDVIDGDFYGAGYQIYENETNYIVDGYWAYDNG